MQEAEEKKVGAHSSIVKENNKKSECNGNENAKSKIKQKNNKKISKFFSGIFYLILIGFISGLFLLYGPIKNFREWYITTAMTTMTHQYLATWFYSEDVIADVLNNNKVIEVSGITNLNEINTNNINTNEQTENVVTYANEYEKAILEKDSSHPEYKIINISGSTYKRIFSSHI